MGGYRAGLGPEGAAAANARREAAAGLQPIGRQAGAEEVASVAVFLASRRVVVHDRRDRARRRRLHHHVPPPLSLLGVRRR